MKTTTFTKLTAGITLSLIASTMLHATNGDTLIAVGAKSRGMGGTGIGISHGAESTLANPAMITTIEGTEISFGGTIFMPKVSSTLNTVPGRPVQPKYNSDADLNMIPEVSLAHKINENWYIGIGMWGTAGMGVDYSQATPSNLFGGQYANFNMVTNLQLMQFAIPVAYKNDGLSIAVAPILQYGNLDINFKSVGTVGLPPVPYVKNVGAGLAQDFGFGWSAGASYDFNNGLTVGAVYKSSITMNYKGQLNNAASEFGLTTIGDKLEQPAEYGLGLSYVMGHHTFAFDWKRIQWSSATGYKDFGWDNQNVYAFGYQFAQDNYALRIGYNYASSPLSEQAEIGNGVGSALNMLNLLGFPANAEKHLTLGGTYTFTQQFSLDLAYVHAFNQKDTFATPAFSALPPVGFGIKSITTEHSEDSLSFQLTYAF